jgi:hypothetical protein
MIEAEARKAGAWRFLNVAGKLRQIASYRIGGRASVENNQ